MKQFRKELKDLGFKVSIKRNSLGSFATYTHIETKNESSMLYNEETLKLFEPLFNYLSTNRDKVIALAKHNGINIPSLIIK